MSQHGVVNAAVLSAFGERGLFGPRLLPLAPGFAGGGPGQDFTGGESYAAEGFPLRRAWRGHREVRRLASAAVAVGPQRIEAQLPSLLGMEALEAGGTAWATVVVETAQGSSYPRRFLVAAHAPGVFTASGAGTGQAAALLAGVGDARGAARGRSGQSRPARAGTCWRFTPRGWAGGPAGGGRGELVRAGRRLLGRRSNVALRRTAARPRVSIGGVEVAEDGVLFSGLAPALAAVHLVVVKVPAGIEPSAAAEVIIAIGGRASQPGFTIAVE